MHQIDPESETITPDDDSLYPYVNNDIKYGLFEDIVDSSYLDSQIKDNFQCNHNCYSQQQDLVKVYQHSTHFPDIYQYITDGKLPSRVKVQNCIRAEAPNYVVINNFLFRIDM